VSLAGIEEYDIALRCREGIAVRLEQGMPTLSLGGNRSADCDGMARRMTTAVSGSIGTSRPQGCSKRANAHIRESKTLPQLAVLVCFSPDGLIGICGTRPVTIGDDLPPDGLSSEA
jgi:hypothetical protein